MCPQRLLDSGGRPLSFTVRRRDMPHDTPHEDWLSAGEYDSGTAAAVVSARLTAERIPNRMVPYGPRNPGCSVWVRPEWIEKAKALLSQDAVPEDELTKLALSYPAPDDAEDLK
jgi:hypothetical protein